MPPSGTDNWGEWEAGRRKSSTQTTCKASKGGTWGTETGGQPGQLTKLSPKEK